MYKSDDYEPGTFNPGTFKIEGIDINRGLMMTGNSHERYREVLALYCRDASERLKSLENMPDQNNLSSFITQVHALKSASASIGASSLSEQAAFLEDAGNKGDMDAIRDRLDGFHEYLSIMIQRIDSTLSSLSAAAFSQDGGLLDKTALINLKTALEKENISDIDSLFDMITKGNYNKNCNNILTDISEYILMSEFDSAIDLINNLLTEGDYVQR